MPEPTSKNPQIEELLTAITGKDRPATIRSGLCTTCNAYDVVPGLRDDLSRKEYTISGMCQACQDKVFGP